MKTKQDKPYSEANHCCDSMRSHLKEKRYEPNGDYNFDCVIDYWKDGRYGIPINDGGASMVVIKYCPWCGTKLPDCPDD